MTVDKTTMLRILVCALCGAAVGVAKYVFGIDLHYDTAIAVAVPALVAGGQTFRRAGDLPPLGKHGSPDKVPFFMALCLALTFSACLHGGAQAEWPKYAKCGVGPVSNLVATVARILLAGSGSVVDGLARKELNELAANNGADVVSCLVETLVRDWTTPPSLGGTTNAYRVDAALRGRNFLNSVGTTPYWE